REHHLVHGLQPGVFLDRSGGPSRGRSRRRAGPRAWRRHGRAGAVLRVAALPVGDVVVDDSRRGTRREAHRRHARRALRLTLSRYTAPVAGARKADEIERGRAAYRRQAWAEAHRCFAAADGKARLTAPDLELYALSTARIGGQDDYIALMDRLYQVCLEAGDPVRAARWAFWLGFRLAAQREMGRAGGWLARAERLVEKIDCVEKGYLQLPAVHRLAAAGDVNGARAAAAEAAAYGDRFGDPDLSAFGRCLEGRVLLRQGQVAR